MTAFAQAAFYVPTAIGVVGILLWALFTWADPSDDTIGASFRIARKHTRTLVVAVASYFALCVLLYERDLLNWPAALACGYFNQDMWVRLMEIRRAALLAKLNDGKGD
jgi:hypothetical protein